MPVHHLLRDQAAIQCAKAYATALCDDVQVHEAGLVRLFEDSPVVGTGAIVLRRHRDDLILSQVEELLSAPPSC